MARVSMNKDGTDERRKDYVVMLCCVGEVGCMSMRVDMLPRFNTTTTEGERILSSEFL